MGLALVVLLASSCFHVRSCGPTDTCSGDSDCETGFVCDEDDLLFVTRSCVAALECQSTADCPKGNSCTQRAGSDANNPFEEDSPGKKVCTCNDSSVSGVCESFGSSGGFSSSSGFGSSSSGFGSSGGLGGHGGSGGHGGAGGHGGSGGAMDDGGLGGGQGGGL